MSELDRLLRDVFPDPKSRAGAAQGRRPPAPTVRRRPGPEEGIGDFDPSQRPTEGQVPGVAWADTKGALRQQLGPLPGDKEAGPPPLTADAVAHAMRMMYLGLQLHTRPPSHVEAPFSARPINKFTSAMVSVPDSSWTDILSYTVPQGRFRAEITHMGWALSSANAWEDTAWRILVDGQPYEPYEDVRVQVFHFSPPTRLPVALHLNPQQTIKIQARQTADTGARTAAAIIGGWVYPTVLEAGTGEVKGTLVDLT